MLAVLSRRHNFPQWFTAADFTSDICRSRTFTVTSFSWLLFSFYWLLTDYFVNADSGAYKKIIIELGVPMALYFLILSFMWVPHFVILLIANNPFRHGRRYFVASCIGLMLQHVSALAIIFIKVSKLSTSSSVTVNSGATNVAMALQQSIAMDITFCVLLLSAMDISFLKMTLALINENFSFYKHFMNGCLRLTRSRLASARGATKPSIASKVVLHLVLPRSSLPSQDDISSHLALRVFGGLVDSRRLLVKHIARLEPGSGDQIPAPGSECHPDFVLAADGKGPCAHLKLRDLRNPHALPWSRPQTKFLPLNPSQMILRVEVLVLGVCATLTQRKWLCEMLEEELKKQEAANCSDKSHISRALIEIWRTLPPVDGALVDMLIERLNAKALQGLTLRGAHQTCCHDTNNIVELQLKFGATFAALRETILAEACCGVESVTEEERRETKREKRLDHLTRTGVSTEHAEILVCLPERDFEELRASIEQAQHSSDSQATLQECVMQKLSGLFGNARDVLLAQLSSPAFRAWLRDHQKSLENIGVKTHLPAARDYPLSALFAFFAAGAGHDLDIKGGELDLSPEEIIKQMIQASHSHLALLTEKKHKSDSNSMEACRSAPTEESDDDRKRRVLKKFRRTVHIGMTLTNNPSLMQDKTLHGKEKIVSAGDHGCDIHLVSVLQDAPGSQSVNSTRFVLITPEELSAMAEERKGHHQALWVPTAIFICALLSMLLVTRTFCMNMISLASVAEWLMGIVTTLETTCDRVEMMGKTGAAIFQCFTPGKLQAIVESEASAELQKSVSDLMELRNSDEVAGAASSINAVQKITENVDFTAMQQVGRKAMWVLNFLCP